MLHKSDMLHQKSSVFDVKCTGMKVISRSMFENLISVLDPPCIKGFNRISFERFTFKFQFRFLYIKNI